MNRDKYVQDAQSESTTLQVFLIDKELLTFIFIIYTTISV